ncbi:MAG: histidine phosphatase family protein [Bacteroidota bacterium]
MSQVYLIRHGQASFMEKNYDQLSELGQQQARKLGAWLYSKGLAFDQLYSGTLERQINTCKLSIGEESTPTIDHSFNEHEGPAIFKNHFPTYLRDRQELGTAIQEKGMKEPSVRKQLVKAFFQMHHMWVKGEIESGEHESWTAFKERSSRAFEIIESAVKNGSVAVYTSGGLIAALLGQVLGLGDEKIVDLNWQIRNTSIAELKYSSGRFMLREFNTTPHLEAADVTYV